jgi:hypothetical protein
MSPTTTIRVVIPWLAGCEYRQADLAYVLKWWRDHHPTWPVTVGTHHDGPWRKGLAVHNAGPYEDDSVIIVADADVIPSMIIEAVSVVLRRGGWAMPHKTVYRLTHSATAALVTGNPLPDPNAHRRLLQPQLQRVHPGYAGGGITVVHGRVLQDVPIDPRFAGWGQEDQSWGFALSRMAGSPWRGQSILWHLWHPPQDRMPTPAGATDRGIGSPMSAALYGRSRSATTPDTMRALVQEAREILDQQHTVTTRP